VPSDAPAPGRAAEIEAFWLDFQRARAIAVEGFSATAFGHTRTLADELADLVARGVKRAHATLLRDFEKDLEPLPRPGDHVVVLDGEGRPRAIVRATRVEKRHFRDIDEAFAFEAGEGDGTLRWWQAAHRQDYAERGEVEGFEAHEGLELVLEHFDLVWPPLEGGAASA